MSYQPLWLRDLVAYSVQAAALVGVGTLMASLLRLRLPRVRHAYWQALLAVCVFLPFLQPWRPEMLESSGAALSNITLAAPAAVAAPAGPSLAEMVLLLICAGIVLRTLWMTLGLGRLWLYRRRAQRLEAAPQAVEEAQRLVPVFPRFFISRQLPTPATFGFFRPAILFPTRFLEMQPAMQKAIALHELLHVERRDWLWNMFEELVLTLLWFHLPLWWVVRSARLSREQVVDAEAVRRSNARRPYLKALLEMAGQKRLAESLPAPLFLRESQLAERVALMMKEVHMSRTRLTFSILTATCALLIVGASLVWAFPLKSPAPQAETSAPSSKPAQNVDGTYQYHGKDYKFLGQVYKVGGKVEAPEPINNPAPAYTPQARKNHLTGTVVFSVVVDATGRVVEVKQVSKPLGQGLDESAIRTIRSWTFKPGMRDGVPVPVRVQAEITFKLYEKADEAAQKPGSAIDPPAQSSQNTSADTNGNHNANINQDEIQRQIDEAMKHAKIAQQAASKIDQEKIQEQVVQAMKQLKMAKIAAPQIDQAKINLQIKEQMKQLQKLNTQQMREQMQKQMEQLSKLNSPEMRQRIQEQMKQLQKVNTPEMHEQMKKQMEQLQKMNNPEIRRKIEEAMKQAQVAKSEAQELNSAEVRRQLKQTRDELQAARKQLEQAREQLKKQQLELQMQRKKARTPPSSPVLPAPPAPPSSGKVATPPAPPASPAPPPALPSTGKVSVPPAPPASPAPPPVIPSTDRVVPPAPSASPVPPPPPAPQS